jgi:hypothetical protein
MANRCTVSVRTPSLSVHGNFSEKLLNESRKPFVLLNFDKNSGEVPERGVIWEGSGYITLFRMRAMKSCKTSFNQKMIIEQKAQDTDRKRIDEI